MSGTKPASPDAAQEPVRSRRGPSSIDEAVEELLRTGRPIDVPSLDKLADRDVDLEDDEGGVEGL